MPQASVVDQAFLHKLERLTIRWQKSFPGAVGGRHPSRFAGPGQEFLDHRHFHHGDDLRAVNWRAYLRLEKLFLKMFQVEPRIPVRLLLDASASMTAVSREKFDYARRLAAALCYVGLVRLDTIALQPFRERLGESLVCGGGRHRFAPAVSFLDALKPGGRTDYMTVARDFAAKYPQRGLIIVISDFLDETDPEKPLQFLADFGHELLLVHVWAPEDREPPWDGDLDLIDAESGRRMELTTDATARASYIAAFDEYARHLNVLAHRTGGRYVGLPTDTPLEEAIFGPLSRAGSLQ